MAAEEFENINTPQEESNIETKAEEPVPIGIERIRQEWRNHGLTPQQQSPAPHLEETSPVVFSEIDGGAGIGDYTLDCETVKTQLAISQDALDRLIAVGELDSVIVQGPDGEQRRLFSESSLKRFIEDSAIDPEAVQRAAKNMADKNLVEAIQQLQEQVSELQGTQGKVLQQMKDILLLEVRNLKEQDRDLASFVYELAEEIRELLGKKKR